MAIGQQALQRGLDTGVQPGMDGDGRVIGGQKQRKILLLGLWGDQHSGTGAGVTGAQHGAPALKRDGCIGHRIKPVQPAPGQNGIGRADQIACGIGKRAIQIEDHGSGHAVTFRQIK